MTCKLCDGGRYKSAFGGKSGHSGDCIALDIAGGLQAIANAIENLDSEVEQ